MIKIKHRFSGVVLASVADLRSADLRSADLWGADLRSADLRGADLWGADLRSADLRGADLRSADLRGADLRGADLRGADLPVGFRIASLCFGGWPVTVTPTHTTIGCQYHTNVKWLKWTPAHVAHMANTAKEWWTDHGAAVKAVIRNVQEKPKVKP